MAEIEIALGSAVDKLSDQNYAESLTFYRLWLDIGQTYHQIPSDRLYDTIWNNRRASSMNPGEGKLIHSTAHLIVHFASDTESGHFPASHSSGLQSHPCARSLREFFTNNLQLVWYKDSSHWADFYSDANLIAHWPPANLGSVDEAAIRDHILQSLISHPKLHDHQADALVILFKLAGPTFEAYAEPSVIDRCFYLLKGHTYYNPRSGGYNADDYAQARRKLLQVCAARAVKGVRRAKMNL